jgi:hypothetical protein
MITEIEAKHMARYLDTWQESASPMTMSLYIGRYRDGSLIKVFLRNVLVHQGSIL